MVQKTVYTGRLYTEGLKNIKYFSAINCAWKRKMMFRMQVVISVCHKPFIRICL